MLEKMMPNKRRLAKKKKREKEVRKRILKRREDIREQSRLEREIENLKWENRERITPIRKIKEVDE
jgi:hypothetical protein